MRRIAGKPQAPVDKKRDLSNNIKVHRAVVSVSQLCGGIRYRYRSEQKQIRSGSAVDHVISRRNTMKHDIRALLLLAFIALVLTVCG